MLRPAKCSVVFVFFFPDFWPNHGPGRLPSDSGRGNVELTGVCASVASITVSFVSECIFWNPVRNKALSYGRAMAGSKTLHLRICQVIDEEFSTEWMKNCQVMDLTMLNFVRAQKSPKINVIIIVGLCSWCLVFFLGNKFSPEA